MQRLTLSAITALSLVAVGMALFLQGCTTIGLHHPSVLRSMDFGPPEEVRFCVLLEEGISQEYTEKLLLAWNKEEGPQYNLSLRPVSFERHRRSGFTFRGIIEDLKKMPLPNTCDRIIFFVGRNFGDTLYSVGGLLVNLASPVPVPVPVVRGAVNDETLTHGFVVAALAAPQELLDELFLSRQSVTIHELYHFFGCEHSYTTMDDCYKQIQTLKETYRDLKSRGYYAQIGEEPFFPTRSLKKKDTVLTTRKEVNTALGNIVE